MRTKKLKEKLNWFYIKRGIFLGLLVIYAVMMLTHLSVFYHDFTVSTANGSKQRMTLQPNDVITQEFVAKNTNLSTIAIRFQNPVRKHATGEVLLEVYDKNGDVLGFYSYPTKSINHGGRTSFPLHIELEKGETYYYKITLKDAVNNSGFFLRFSEKKGDLFGKCVWNDVEYNGRVESHFRYARYDWKLIIITLALFAFILVLLLLPKKYWDKLKDSKWNRRLGQLFFVLSPFVTFWIVERFNSNPITSLLKKPEIFALNLIIYVTILMILYLITNRTRAAALILTLSMSLLGCVNYYIYNFRGAPLLPTDFSSAGTALNVASNYKLFLDLDILMSIILLMAFCIPIALLPGSKGLSLKKRIIFLIATCMITGSTYYIYFGSTVIKDNGIVLNVWKPQRSYNKYGFAMCFAIHSSYTIPEKPDGYNLRSVEEITSRYESDPVSSSSEQPNIICIMNESFTDLNFIADVETTEDIMPFIHSMKENTIKGRLCVSVFGGNTANSEFSFLTGNSLAFLPFRSVPYNLYIKDPLPSLTYSMIGNGYTGNKALHPYYSTGWKRNVIYPLLGFTDFLSLPDCEGQEYLRRYVSDAGDYAKVIEEYEASRATSDAPFYMFNVTMQNHGGYGFQTGQMDEPIDFTDTMLNTDIQAHQFINLIHRSDEAIKDLVGYFENVEEPTVIVFFGDHLPKLGDEVYERLYGKSLDALNIEETSRMYQTPFFIWANYDIPEAELDGISVNYLSSYMLKALDLPMTGYNKYLMDLYETLPVVTQICYKDSEGNLYDPEDPNFPYADLLNEYHKLQYNNMFDTKNRVEDFFTLQGVELPEDADPFE